MKKPAIVIKIYQWLSTAFGTAKPVFSNEKRNAVLFLLPDYGNVGDLAIGYAEQVYLEEQHDMHVIAISVTDTYRALKHVRRNLKSGDIAFLVGGGSMGDLYPRATYGRRFIARYLRRCPIISFPQSVVSKTPSKTILAAKAELSSLAPFASSLVLFARERKTKALMESYYPGEVHLSPDIVFYLAKHYRHRTSKRSNQILLVLRNDTEKKTTVAENALLNSIASEYGKAVQLDHEVSLNREDLKDLTAAPRLFLDEYSRSSLVITDRLHGMIFSAITRTPCVVLPNANHKVEATYEDWIEDQCGFIDLVDEITEKAINDAIRKVLRCDLMPKDEDVLEFDFSELDLAIKRTATR